MENWDPDILPFSHIYTIRHGCLKKYPRIEQQLCDEESGIWYTYYINNPITKQRQWVDENSLGSATFGFHTSELGWNLPRGHPRHILNFPAEILSNIMSFVLVADVPVYPSTATNQQRTDWRHEPCYKTNNWDTYDQRELPFCKYKVGQWIEIRHVRAPIDATLLRVNKFFHVEGRKLLYSENLFEFDLESEIYDGGEEDEFYELAKGFPRVSLSPEGARIEHSLDVPGLIDEVRNDVKELFDKNEAKDLPGWMYYDPFARFLYSIGSTNASLIRKIRITGILGPAHLHQLNKYAPGRHHAPWTARYYLNLSYYVKLYVGFLEIYCKNLQTFEIGITNIAVSYFKTDHQGCNDVFTEGTFLEDENDYLLEADLHDLLDALDDDESDDEDLLEEITRKLAGLLVRRQNRVILSLNPLLQDFCPKMKQLQFLRVKRRQPKQWRSIGYLHQRDESDPYEIRPTWGNSVPVDIFKEIQDKLDKERAKRRYRGDHQERISHQEGIIEEKPKNLDGFIIFLSLLSRIKRRIMMAIAKLKSKFKTMKEEKTDFEEMKDFEEKNLTSSDPFSTIPEPYNPPNLFQQSKCLGPRGDYGPRSGFHDLECVKSVMEWLSLIDDDSSDTDERDHQCHGWGWECLDYHDKAEESIRWAHWGGAEFQSDDSAYDASSEDNHSDTDTTS